MINWEECDLDVVDLFSEDEMVWLDLPEDVEKMGMGDKIYVVHGHLDGQDVTWMEASGACSNAGVYQAEGHVDPQAVLADYVAMCRGRD